MEKKSLPLFVKNGRELIAIRPENIICMKASGNFCCIYVNGVKEPLIVCRTYSGLMETCLGNGLVQIHRGVSINICSIQKIGVGEVTLCNGMKMSISKNHWDEIVGKVETV